MRSTGEVMGVANGFDEAYAKANLGASEPIPVEGKVLLSVRNNDKQRLIGLAKEMIVQGFTVEATKGTAHFLAQHGVLCGVVNKLSEGRPNIVDAIKNGEYCYVVNTTEGRQAINDSVYIRREALLSKTSYTTTLNAAFATIRAKTADAKANVTSVQELHKRIQ
jgi:carbamoyl-phosphate synthase large subunit